MVFIPKPTFAFLAALRERTFGAVSEIFSKENEELGKDFNNFDLLKGFCYDAVNFNFPWKPYPWILKSGLFVP